MLLSLWQREYFQQLLCILVFSLVCVSQWATSRGAEAKSPNVILLLTDDQGYGDVGFHGNAQIRTPHMDQLAREGMELTRFYCSPVCAPTRASLMTGRYYYRSGVIHTSRGGAKMHGAETTLAELLQANGYATGIFGKWHLGDNYPMRPQDQGFMESLVHKSGGIGQTPDKPNSYFDPWLWKNGKRERGKGYCTDLFFDAALEFMDRQSAEGKPFFVYLPTNAPHTPLEIADAYWKPYLKQGLNETTARVYGMVENLDENLGRLMAHLEQKKLQTNTILIFLGDNGPQQKRYTAGLKGRKSWVYEGGIRVPFVASWPGHIPEGTQSAQIAAHIDLLPTLLAMTGTPKPKSLKLDGIDLSGLLTGKVKTLPARSLFFQVHRGLTPQRYQNCAVVTQRYKLVGYPGTFGEENLMRDAEPVLELYDLAADPGETKNLISDKPEIADKLRQGYQQWFSDVKQSRHFQPGMIVIDSRKENPTTLCRYQDGSFAQGNSQGWMVQVETPGLYEIQIQRGTGQKPGKLSVNWQGQETHEFLQADESSARFELKSGSGLLDIWFQEEGADRVYPGDNSTRGDVILKRLD
ncbi:Arylsulfatase [Gimesia panareensis]|uniref:Arylsulfatase n=1 Tax=Gimesia panareensis TaxID=2527978 RepID=A0A518FRP8_9PLAN|nr:arylsulfatase [Gimesia panareensis]QDV18970.1 Arylsulfatase [Gimesia panareensis]